MKYGSIIATKIQRDGLVKTGIAFMRYPFRILHYKFMYRRALRQSTLEEKFTLIFDKNLWGSRESSSGIGSEIAYTESLRDWIIQLIRDHDVKTIVDAPCGDFNWMRFVLSEVDVDYVGLDIVAGMVQANNDCYGDENVEFIVADICTDELPGCDLLIVRDFLFHLSWNDTDRFLENIAGLEFKYLLTTSHLVDKRYVNSDVVSGDFRLIDIFRRPYYFNNQHVIDRIHDFPEGYAVPREMVLFAKKNVPNRLTHAE